MSIPDRNRSIFPFSMTVAALGLFACQAISADTPPSSASSEAKPEPPATHAVQKGRLKTKVQMDAIFESAEMAPVKISPKLWLDMTVLEAVPHGAYVQKGDVLVKLDTEKLKDQIEDLELDRPGAAVALATAVAELDNLKQTTPLKLATTRRVSRQADDDFVYFEKTGRGQRERGSRFGLKSAEQMLDNANEELKQLEKMYKADDLTEETEEIILRRQRFALESAQFNLERMKITSERDLGTLIPREHDTLKTAKEDQANALTLAEQTLPKALEKKQLDVEKLKRDQKKADKKLADYKQDLENMDVRAPISGLVYYGACENAKWPTAGLVAKKLIPGGKLAGGEVFMTIVNTQKLVLRAMVQEPDLAQLKPGLVGKATPAAAPDRKLTVKLEDINYIPYPGGGFETKLSLKPPSGVRLLPGMTCKVAFEGVQKPPALLVPKTAVFTEEGQKQVYLVNPEGGHEKRAVKTGESDEKMTEILEGVKEGDKVLLKKPEAPAKS